MSLCTLIWTVVCASACYALVAGDEDTNDGDIFVQLRSTTDQSMPGPPDFCLEGPYHKDAPSPEGEGFQECVSWRNLACCNVALAESIRVSKSVALYNYSWDLCGPLSPECEEYIKDEECFYQCEPMLGYFQIGMTGYIADVPVCADYCDAWFEACKNDMTCVEDWLEDYNYEHGGNTCPNGSMCVTFEQMYGNGEGLCNRMWGDAFFYETSDNCTVMRFDPAGDNPNFDLLLQESSATVQCATIYLIVLLVVAITIAHLTV